MRNMILFLLCLVLLVGCSNTNNKAKTELKPNSQIEGEVRMKNNKTNLNLEDFSFLKKGMTYQEISKHVGLADAPVGSGLNMLRYNLSDGSYIILNFFTGNTLVGVNIVYPDGSGKIIISSEE
jgi:hypothetical protein